MTRWLWILCTLTLAGCAGDGYRYHDDGYYTSAPPARSVVIGGSFSACAGWGGGFGYPAYGYGGSPCGYGYGHGFGYGQGYGYGYAPWFGSGIGYWRDPYWSQRWYLPRTIEPPRAGARARQLAADPSVDPDNFPRYEQLAPARRRDVGSGAGVWMGSGGGGASGYRSVPPSAPRGVDTSERGWRVESGRYPSSAQGISSSRYNGSQGLSGSSRSSFDSAPSPRSSGFDAPRSAASEARSVSRNLREEE